MQSLMKLLFGCYVFLANRSRTFKHMLIRSLRMLKKALANESKETQEMLKIYYAYPKGKATKEEVKWANDQFKDFLKTTGLGIFLILPFAPITIPFIVKLGKVVGVEILPSSFQEIFSPKSARSAKESKDL